MLLNKLKIGRYSEGFKQFIVKTGIFVLVFIVLSYLLGRKAYDSDLLYGFKFYIYGGMGYILLFSILGFILLYRKELLKMEKSSVVRADWIFLAASAILAVVFYLVEINISQLTVNMISILLLHLLLIAMVSFLVIGIYGSGFTTYFIKKFRKELIYFIIFGIVAYSLMNAVWGLWPYLSAVVTSVVHFMLGLFSSNVQYTAPDIITFEGFGVQIGEPCSGIYSIFIFAGLYLFIMLIDWKKINKVKAFSILVPAVLGAFIVNILRVFLLMIVGARLSREAAMGLYHSYTGMIFFMVYFVIFWVFAYKWITLPGRKGFKERDTIPSRIVFLVKKFYKHFMSDSLYRNSIYLILGTAVMALLGFAFWAIVARLYTAEQVGLATTIISVMGIITSLSILGLGAGLIRFLPKSERKNDNVNTCFTLAAIVTIIITTIFLLGLQGLSPKLLFIKKNAIYSFVFIIFMVFATLSSLIESVFMAYRSSGYILMKNAIFGVLKLAFPVMLVFLGSYGIFGSWMLSLMAAYLVSLAVLIRRFSYKPKIVFYDSILKRIGKYSFGNYLAGFIGGLSTLLLPIIITNLHMAETTAYYYIAMSIAGVLFIIPQATTNSLFVEGSHDERAMSAHIRKAIKITAYLSILAIIVILLAGKYVLLFFGQDYASQGAPFLNILAISCIFVSINSIYGAVLRVRKQVVLMIIMAIITSATIVGLSYFSITHGFGLRGIGYSYLAGQLITSAIYAVLVRKKK